MPGSHQSFADLLKHIRAQRGLTLRQLEAETGISNGYLSQIESGQVGAPSAKIIQRLSAALGSSQNELMAAAGYIMESEVPEVPFLHLGDRTLPLGDLTSDDKAELLKFVELLKNKGRSR